MPTTAKQPSLTAARRWQDRMAEGRRRRLDREADELVRRATALEREARRLARNVH